jgi:PEP-CTERM motif-containing protein
MLEMSNFPNLLKSGSMSLIFGVTLLTVPAYGAQYQLGVLIRAGFSATGAGAWELGAGDSSGSPATTSDATPFWSNDEDRHVEIEYQKPTNNLQVRLYQDATNTSGFSQVNFSPTGGAAVAASATWVIPTSSFFVTAASGPTPPSSISLSNITLGGISGALNILQPLQQTTLTASRGANGATSTVAQSSDIVFQGDATGSWLLTGNLNLKGFAGPAGVSGNDLAFSFGGTAVGAAVPEPTSVALVGLGMLALVLIDRFRRLDR